MPSPQSLVTFLVMLFCLLLLTRTRLNLSPNLSTFVSVLVSLAIAWAVDRRVPPDEEEIDEDDASVSPGEASPYDAPGSADAQG